MSSVLQNLLPNLQFRRPALRRQSALVPLHRALDDYIRRMFEQVVDGYIVLIETFGAQVGPYTTNMFIFDVPEELAKVRPAAKTVLEVLYDYTWGHIISGNASDDFLRDRRIQAILRETIMGLPIKAWLEWTLLELYSHIVKESKNLIPNALLKYAVEGTLKSLLRQCPTFLLQAETLSDFMQELLKKMPGNTVLYNELHKMVYGVTVVDPEVFYTHIRQLLIMPPALMACIKEELACQEALDTLEYSIRQEKQTRRATKRTTTRQSSLRRRGSSTRLDQRRALCEARQAVSDAEDRTAKLVKWYEVSEEVAKKCLAYQKTLMGEQDVLQKTNRVMRKWLRAPVYTDAQRNARRRLKEALGVQARCDPSRTLRHTKTRTIKPVSLFEQSLLKILLAALSPFHIYHTKWTGEPEFVALTHHLHMLNFLPTLAVYIPKNPTDYRYVRHVRGVPFTDSNTKKNQQLCMRNAKLNHEAWCSVAIGMNNPMYPRDILLKEKHCDSPAMLARAKKSAAKSYRRIEREVKCRGKSTLRTSRKKV